MASFSWDIGCHNSVNTGRISYLYLIGDCRKEKGEEEEKNTETLLA